jgi:diketogulonate reductase-like aldo/keto reductase
MNWSRRALLAALAALPTAGVLHTRVLASSWQEPLVAAVPSSGEEIPVIGLGSWITFNVGRSPAAIGNVAAVMKAFFEEGGRMIDSSPMYGSSQAAIGQALKQIEAPSNLLATDKVWTSGKADGIEQINETARRWQRDKFSLLQVHNLADWEAHLGTLFQMKAEGALRYVGVTTSHGRRHRELAHVMESQPIDFVQLTYNMTHRSVENRLLPLTQEKGIAVIANRPLDGGRLIRRLKKQPVSAEVSALGFQNWSEFLLKFVVSHPGVTCAIPATSQVPHLRENMKACRGDLPNTQLRLRMLRALENV